MHLYIIQAGKDGPIKIGITRNGVKNRIKSLQEGCPEKLRLLHVFKNGEFEEKKLHNLFKHLRIHGEWFKYAGELKEFIKDPMSNKMNVTIEKLNITRIRVELAKIDKNQSWLAKQLGYTRAYISHLIKTKSLKHVDKFAEVFDLDPKDLII